MRLKKKLRAIERVIEDLDVHLDGRFHRLNTRIDTLLDNHIVSLKKPFDGNIDWDSSFSIACHYSQSDLKALLKVCVPYYAGPLFYTLLSGIRIISGLKYGFANQKRSFIKFLVNDMNMTKEMGTLIYQCKKQASNSGTWPGGVEISAKKSETIFLIRKEKYIVIFVQPLIAKYLRLLDRLDESEMTCKFPKASDWKDVYHNAISQIKENEDSSYVIAERN